MLCTKLCYLFHVRAVGYLNSTLPKVTQWVPWLSSDWNSALYDSWTSTPQWFFIVSLCKIPQTCYLILVKTCTRAKCLLIQLLFQLHREGPQCTHFTEMKLKRSYSLTLRWWLTMSLVPKSTSQAYYVVSYWDPSKPTDFSEPWSV